MRDTYSSLSSRRLPHGRSSASSCDRHRRLDRHRLRAGQMLRRERLRSGRRRRRAADQRGGRRTSASWARRSMRSRPIWPRIEGVDQLYAAVSGARPVEALLANAGRGLGKGFLDQDFDEVRHVIDTNITGTLYLLQKVGRDMRARDQGRILITGSIAGFMPGTYQAVYNGTKAFLDSFSFALRARAEGHRHHRHLPDARRHRDRVLRARRHAGHQGRPGRRRTIPPMSPRPASTP